MTSQGSSGSERRLVAATFMALAALRPDTFGAARDAGLIVPTLQMLLRTNRPEAVAAEDYMTGAAHPSAFEASSIDMEELVRAANALLPDEIAPMVRLGIERDLAARPGVDFPDPTAREALFTTPAAIARAWRSLDQRRRHHRSQRPRSGLRLSGAARRSGQDHHHPDADDPTRTPARIAIDWHDAYPVPGAEELLTARVDIDVFARNGATVSAPSFLSVVFPVHQNRRHTAGPDGTPRIAEVSCGHPGRGEGGRYADPAIWAVGDWTDSYDWPERAASLR